MAEKITIKDIAAFAGVSAGTVDRVLHNRPNVSAKAREKVEKALKEQNYQPNVYASALAYNRSYHFSLVLPKHEQVAYWEEIEQGVRMEVETRKDFNISVDMFYYRRFEDSSFVEQTEQCLANNPDGVVLVPVDLELTPSSPTNCMPATFRLYCSIRICPTSSHCHSLGRDSFCVGYFAARMLMLIASHDKEIALMKITKNGRVVSKQQDNRRWYFAIT